MRRVICPVLLSVWFVLGAGVSAFAAEITAGNLRSEYASDPLGVETPNPRLSWVLTSAQRGQRQTAYQILAATSEEKLAAGKGDLWDTGKVASDQSIQVPYRGKPLSSREQVYWKVRVWDGHGAASPYSHAAKWEMGLLSPKDWTARWIGYPPGWSPN